MEENEIKEPDVSYGHHYTYSDYLQFGFDEMVEVIKGKLFKMTPAPSSNHQRVSRNISGLLYNIFKNNTCQYFAAPFDVILPVKGKNFMDSDRVVQPDIVVVCDPSKIKERGCFGAPDWVIEILSPHTAKKDLQYKFDLYEESGIKEYWIIDPQYRSVEVFVLSNEKYQRVRAYVEDDQVPCHTMQGLTIDLKEVFDF